MVTLSDDAATLILNGKLVGTRSRTSGHMTLTNIPNATLTNIPNTILTNVANATLTNIPNPTLILTRTRYDAFSLV